ncbi:uncharacterized protein LOC123309709 [Coccinella septempunctata]|uniref:uncharacterized protein LOC123309709 n=1 Tax=Coccinella septempunctata TaxID=41139 RepID=UPI001D08DEEA|nr:uncharacterized protein LOC123309709 [Coccinella septempunctata]
MTIKVFHHRLTTRCFDVLVWSLFGLTVAVCVSSTESARKNQVRFSDDVIVFPKEEVLAGKGKRSENEEYKMPGLFHHDPEFHKLHPEFSVRRRDHDDAIQRNPEVYKIRGDKSQKDDLEVYEQNVTIPLDLIQEINEIGDLNEIARRFVEGDEQVYPDTSILTDRFGAGERNAAVKPKSAGCMPELQTVQLATSLDASILYIPQCTRIERCGGCCSHHLLSCQPVETQPVSYSVLKTQYVGGKNLKLVGKEIVVLEKHTKCKCDCKVKPEDCNRFQVYKKSECRCACTNTDEEKKCYRKNQTKLWDPQLCSCVCREVAECSTGFEFDPIECRCSRVPPRNRYTEAEPRIDYEK